ncbi:hypothetical protein Tco_0300355 [Tanacetum coccineum]
MYRINTRTTQTRAPQLPQTSRNTNPRVSTSTRVIHKTTVSRPQLRSTQMKDNVVSNNSQVKDKKTKLEDHPMISSISNKTKSVTASNDILKSRTSNVNAICATCGKCVFNLNHDACVSKYLNDVNARTKKPKVVPISTRKPKSQANKSIATPPKKTVASESTIQKTKSYCRMLYEKTSKAWKFSRKHHNQQGLLRQRPQSQSLLGWLILDADLEVAFWKSTCFVRDLQGNDLLTNTTALSQELDLLFGPLYDEFFTVGTSSVNKSSSPSVNSQQQDTQPTVNIHPTTKLITLTTIVHAEETNVNKAGDAQFEPYEFVNPFCTPVREVAESSSRNVDNSNMHTFYQCHQSER